MRIVSVTTVYPSSRAPRRGLFVRARLAALASMANLRVVHLEPWFPWLRPWKNADPIDADRHPAAAHVKMFYLPAVLKGLDSYWVKKAVVRELGAEEEVDLIDAHFGFPEGVGCVKAALQLGRPVFITMRGLERPILRYRWRGSQLLWALRKCTGIIAVSDSLRDLAVMHGISGDKIRVIPNAVDRSVYCPGNQTEARVRLGFPVSARLVVSVGMLVHGKGHHLVVDALARLSRKHPDLHLVIVGGPAHEPSYPKRLLGMIESLGLSDRVHLVGSKSPDEVVQWLRAADLFALSTYDEGCCNAILEAMGCGLPVVTTPAGDNALLVNAPERGVLVPMDDAAALAEGIGVALSTDWDRARIAAYGADYSWDEAARRTVQFFHERLDLTRN